MQSSGLNFDIPHFRSTIEQAASKENGWNLQYEGKASKEFSGIYSLLKTL